MTDDLAGVVPAVAPAVAAAAQEISVAYGQEEAVDVDVAIEAAVACSLPLKKHYKWDLALHPWALDMAGRGHVWGTLDCTHIVSGALAVMTGQSEASIRFAAGVTRTYSTSFGAARVLAQMGGMHEAIMRLGLRRIHGTGHRQRGDVVVVDTEGVAIPELYVVLGVRLLGVMHDDVVRMYELGVEGLGQTFTIYRAGNV